MPVEDPEIALAERISAFFKAHGMGPHLAHLRRYYAGVRGGKPTGPWTRAHVHEWARMLRIPPHENDYPVLPRGAPCPGCDVSRPYTATVFPGGHLSRCACGTAWLVLEQN